MNLNQIRVFVRTQLDLDETDLPDILLDLYVQDGYDHIISLENRWPFFETTWSVAIPTGLGATLPVDADTIESLIAPGGRRMWRVDPRWGEDNFGGDTTGGTSRYWSQINRTITLYPPSASDLVCYARGFRKPTDWIAGGASAEVDADTRLHLPICWYACSVGYAQQEDEVLEATYLNRFHEAANIAHTAVMRPWPGSPRILNGTRYAIPQPSLNLLPPSPPVPITHAIGGTP